jgi:hypothetical protein
MPLHNSTLVRIFMVFFLDRLSYFVLRNNLFTYLYNGLNYSLEKSAEYTKIFDFNIIALFFAGFAIKFGIDHKAILTYGFVFFLSGFGVLWGFTLLSDSPLPAIGIWAVGTAFIKVGLFIQIGNDVERPSLVLRNYMVTCILAALAVMLSGLVSLDSTEFNFDCGILLSFSLSLLAFILYRVADNSYSFKTSGNKILFFSVAALGLSAAFAVYLTNIFYNLSVVLAFGAFLTLLWKEKKFTGLKIGLVLLYLYCVSYLFIETFEKFVRVSVDPISKITHYIGGHYMDINLSYTIVGGALITCGTAGLILRQGRFEVTDNFKALERVMWGIIIAAAGYFFFSYINYTTTSQIPMEYFIVVLICMGIAEIVVRSTTLALIFKLTDKNNIGLAYASSIGFYFTLNDLIYQYYDVSREEITKTNYAAIASIICFIIIILFLVIKLISKLTSTPVYESESTN